MLISVYFVEKNLLLSFIIIKPLYICCTKTGIKNIPFNCLTLIHLT